MGQSEKRVNKMTLQWGIPTVILMVFVIVTLVRYSNVMEKEAGDKALSRISRQAVSVAGYYNGVLDAYIGAAESIADNLVGSDDLFAEENVKILGQLSKKFELRHAYIVKSDLSAIDESGKILDVISDKEEIVSLIDAKSERGHLLDDKGNPLVIISAPIRTEDDWWGNVLFLYKPNKMPSIIDSTTYSYSLIYSNGLIAESTGVKNTLYSVGQNINDVISGIEFVNGSDYGMQQSLSAGRSGSVAVKDSNGDTIYLTYQPIGNFGACIMVAVGENQIIKSVKEENKTTTEMMYMIIISIIVFVALICTIYAVNRVGFAKQSKELQNKAETDLLTDLLNKVSTEKKIIEYIEGEGADKISMMCVLDIDNFKKINDTMGHAFGDEVLATLGKKIRSEFRVTDIVGRTGGDEFVLFLRDLKSDDIIVRESERIANFFKDFQVGTYTKYSPTASIGAAIFPRDASDYKSLYKAADTALYKAKKRGKNQLAFYHDATEEDKLEAEASSKPKAQE